ncbi:MAG TPA: hypothetical protein VFO65_12375 [Acidimicrobiales bacterium]|nr:hypothetical protein [Acidimicrobiales bacterium]
MASIDNVRLGVALTDGQTAAIDVSYDVTFDGGDAGERYMEVCRMAGDESLALLAPLFYGEVEVREAKTVPRRFARTVPVNVLEDAAGPLAESDELRAVVRLTPVPPTHSKPVSQESNLVRLPVGS